MPDPTMPFVPSPEVIGKMRRALRAGSDAFGVYDAIRGELANPKPAPALMRLIYVVGWKTNDDSGRIEVRTETEVHTHVARLLSPGTNISISPILVPA